MNLLWEKSNFITNLNFFISSRTCNGHLILYITIHIPLPKITHTLIPLSIPCLLNQKLRRLKSSMADHQRLALLLVLFSCFLCSSFAYQFVAGGRDGWVLNPSENYSQWAQRNRFQVNDTILFKYKNGSDSVMVVNKDDYDNCNTGNPILKLDDGDSIFKFDRSGPFYFISGNKSNCDQGQKLIVVVMAVRSPPPPPTVPSPTAAPPQTSSAPSPSPSTGAPSTANSPPSPSPSPAGGTPTPANSPFSPSGGAPTPANSPSSPSPSGGAPAPGSGGSAPSPAGSSLEPPSSSTTPGSPGGASTPGSGTPADVNGSPPPRRSLAAPSLTPSMVVISTVSLVLSRVVLGGQFMV